MIEPRRLTSVEAAEMLGVDRSTTYRAASSGLVEGAAQEERVGTINPPWVATEAAWRNWFENKRKPGRPDVTDRSWAVERFGRQTMYMPWYLDAYDRLSALGLDKKTFRAIAVMIGRHEYTWECDDDRAIAIHYVQSECPNAWVAKCQRSGQQLPDNGIVVGMIQRAGGSYQNLYVCPANTGQ